MPELPDDFAARVRAARGYADAKSQAAFGKLIGVSGTTIKNYENGSTRPDERASAETVKRLAKAAKLPEWFFTIARLDSLRLGASGETADERLAKIEGLLRQALNQQGPWRPIADTAQPPGALGRDAASSRPTLADTEQSRSRPGAGSRRGAGR